MARPAIAVALPLSESTTVSAELLAAGFEVIEIEVHTGAPADGKRVAEVELPEGSRIISLLPRDACGFVPKDSSLIRAGDEVLVILDPGLEDAVMSQFTIEK